MNRDSLNTRVPSNTRAREISAGYERGVAAVAEFDGCQPSQVERGPSRGMFGTPPWYDETCEAQQRAVYAGQLTQAEASFELRYWHRILLAEMQQRKWFRKPRDSASSELRLPGGWRRRSVDHGWARPGRRKR